MNIEHLLVKCIQSSLCWTVNQTEKQFLPEVLMAGEGEEPPEAGEVEAKEGVAVAVALAYVTASLSLACE